MFVSYRTLQYTSRRNTTCILAFWNRANVPGGGELGRIVLAVRIYIFHTSRGNNIMWEFKVALSVDIYSRWRDKIIMTWRLSPDIERRTGGLLSPIIFCLRGRKLPDTVSSPPSAYEARGAEIVRNSFENTDSARRKRRGKMGISINLHLYIYI